MASTRGEIERDVALLLGESVDSPGFGEPMWLRRAVVNAADHVARMADAYPTYFTLDVNGTPTAQSVFCTPRELYKLERALLTLDSGEIIQFSRGVNIVTPAQADKMYPDWQTNPTSGSRPSMLVTRGPDLIFYPYPNWDATAGAAFYGWAIPGDWAGTGVEAATDPFPMPEYARQAVVYYAAWLRCVQFPSKENQVRASMLRREVDAHIGLLVRDAGRAYGGAS